MFDFIGFPNTLRQRQNRPQTLVRSLIDKGYLLFGENRVQEANEKFRDLQDQNLKLHLIGPLQTNKVKLALSLLFFKE